MTTIFIDTCAFLARYLQNDQFHVQSKETWRELENKNSLLFTSNFIINETLTLLARRAGGRFAAQVAERIYNSSVLQIIRPDEQDEKEAIKLLHRFSDQQVGFTDCLSCILMNKNKITCIFTFDQHFRLWKFDII